MPHSTHQINPFKNLLKPFEHRTGMVFHRKIAVIKSMGWKYDKNGVLIIIMLLKNGNESGKNRLGWWD